ncbi:hypothetical protein LTS15_008985 [Exophiala xenobiotica]|nr:hypothetical protein LTS15_008985 [Exophiala xenobiotica]
MTVGRKGHRAGDIAYGDSDFSESPSPSATPSEPATSQQERPAEFGSDQRTLSMRPAPSHSHSWTLPSFQTFVRDTFSDGFHRRSVSTPNETIGTGNMVWDEDLRHASLRSGNRPMSTQSVRLQHSGSQSSNAGAIRPRHHHNQ